MPTQDHHWSQAARSYERDFIDPYRPDVRNPLLSALKKHAGRKKSVADLGCGIGPLLPFLVEKFGRVYAVDFAEGMIERARRRVALTDPVTFLCRSFTDLGDLAGKVNVAVAVNSLVLPDVSELDAALGQIKSALRPGGKFLGIVPAMDAVHYFTMLLVDRALAAGKPIEAARKNAAHLGELKLYDCAFGQFNFQGLEQHFWQPFEVRHRFGRAGLKITRLKKVHLSWEQFEGGDELKDQPPPWDWFFEAEPVAQD